MAHWPEMLQCLEARPDQTAVELLTEFQARYPGFYNNSHLRTLRRRLHVRLDELRRNQAYIMLPIAASLDTPPLRIGR
jgi:hypothetical protein